MPTPALPFVLPQPLGSEEEIITNALGVGSSYSVGIGGRGYIVDTLDQEAPFEFRSYEMQAIPIQKPRIDDQDEPGEQTLAAWWARAQHSWHEGAGQEVFDSEFSSRFAFFASKGFNPWTRGKLTLLKDTTELVNHNVDDHHLLATPEGLIYTHNGNIVKDTDPDTGGVTTLATHNGTPINSLTYDGQYAYAAFSGGSLGVKRVPIAAFTPWTDVNALTAVEVIAFVKGRLIGAKTNALYEFDLAVTTAPQAFHTDKVANWKWTAITESGPAIYASGWAGDRSEIYAMRLTQQDIPFATVATLGAPRSVWQAPEGEKITSIKGYIGQQLLIGTSRGVRIGTVVTGEGDLQVSGLIAETSDEVLNFEPQGDYGWFTWSNYDASSTGLGRVDLGSLAYASDVMFTGSGIVKEVVQYQDRMYFIVDQGATSRIIKEHLTQLVAQAELENRTIRFATTERKTIRFFDLLSFGDGLWSLQVATDGNDYIGYTNDNPTGGYEEEVITLEGSKFSFKLIAKRNPLDATEGPEIQEWRFRAEPKAAGKFRYFVPVMIYDHLTLLNGAETGHDGLALEDLNHLVNLYRTGEDFDFQPLESGVGNQFPSVKCLMEDLRFKSYVPDGSIGFGGHALVVVREVR